MPADVSCRTNKINIFFSPISVSQFNVGEVSVHLEHKRTLLSQHCKLQKSGNLVIKQ